MGLDTKFSKNRQLILLVVGLIPGLFAAAKIFSPGQATAALIVLFVLSRRFARSQQAQFELEEAEKRREAQVSPSKRKVRGKGKSD